MKKRIGSYLYDIFIYFLGCAFASVAINFFLASNEISPGGIAGISTALNYMLGIPSGFLFFIINLPIIIIGFFKMGGIFIIKTGFVSVLFSLMLDISAKLLPVIPLDKILSSVFGGIFLGLGLSLVMLRGATTGGVDIVAKMLNMHFPHLTLGRIILLFDAFVIVLAVIAYRNIESALYSVITMYASAKIIDKLLYGADTGKIVYAITEQYQDISLAINERLSRGVTLISAKGSYTGENRTMMMCTIRKYQVRRVCAIIKEFDSKAFVVICDAGEILGEGFKEY